MAKKEEQRKPIPLEEQEIQNLQIIQNRKTILKNELAEIGLAELALENRKDSAKLFNNKTIEMGSQVGKSLEEKYGKGMLDLDKKVFVPQD